MRGRKRKRQSGREFGPKKVRILWDCLFPACQGLKIGINRQPLCDFYDAILIDTCPSLGSLTINALAAADEVIITVNPQLLAMMGLQDFLKIVSKIRNRINNKLQVAGILLTMCDTRTNLCKVITEEVAETFQGQIRIFKSMVPSTVKVGESVYYSEPLIEYAPENKACEAYKNLAKELMNDEG